MLNQQTHATDRPILTRGLRLETGHDLPEWMATLFQDHTGALYVAVGMVALDEVGVASDAVDDGQIVLAGDGGRPYVPLEWAKSLPSLSPAELHLITAIEAVARRGFAEMAAMN